MYNTPQHPRRVVGGDLSLCEFSSTLSFVVAEGWFLELELCVVMFHEVLSMIIQC